MDTPSPADLARLSPPRPAEAPREVSEDEEWHRPDTIRRFAFFGYKGEEWIEDPQELSQRAWAHTLQALAQLAEEEDWTGAGAGDRPLPILGSYIRYTYQRLTMEEKIAVSEDGEFAALNTGLLTVHAEDIFGLFQRNDHNNPRAQQWKFRRWATESDRDILRNFPNPPEMATYASKASDLVYDMDRDLKLAYDHILVDNIDRFPSDLATEPRRARQALDHAVDLTLKRTRRNFKMVVPQWYPRTQENGFLLPLDLTGSGAADLALVVSAIGDTAYRGHTILTLEMAYTVARLVSRPDSEWLKPQAMPTEASDEE
ncbi:DUF3825 domain-containing protein [Ornithinimicrobium faecis]|uniref:DUF3825 domain-containing protein n=1 Tax=Ornithinimicrobium faecis TaxID=2934158 RepID=A0ABY4YTK6_9MICO|nr:DUF3825 domain-containing protein [Ornithinimicrobium sp. HY1793]USQ80107.1 DUF3825 domain-containing protein [Ornithinimicrobium sp. HY1793]